MQTLKNQLSYPLEVYPVSASQTLKKPCLIPEHDHPSSGFEMSINQSVNPVFPRVTSLTIASIRPTFPGINPDQEMRQCINKTLTMSCATLS